MSKSPAEKTKCLNTLGLLCPEPVMMLHQAIRQAESGQRIQLLADDPSTERDIPKFCRFLGHTLVAQSENAGTFEYLIEKV